MPRTKRLHALKRPKLRQDWSKWNLYNLHNMRTPPVHDKTFFQQKWIAKRLLRSYHNPDVREGTWTRMFDRRLPAVVPMDHRYLARHDGSELARGRGSGVEELTPAQGRGVPRRIEKTSYMHMTFWPLERRLDTAIFRALFASSVRQARQMVVHGSVKVNGKKMIYPGYQLNPGDLFSVDPERVMFSTGAQKRRKNSPVAVSDREKDYEARQLHEAGRTSQGQSDEDSGEFAEYEDAEVNAKERKDDTSASPESSSDGKPATSSNSNKATPKASVKELLRRAKYVLDDSKRKLSGQRLRELRAFTSQARKTFSRIGGADETTLASTVDGLEASLADILSKVPTDNLPVAEAAASTTTTTSPSAEPASTTTPSAAAARARKDAELLHAALERARVNPVDASKPYATPWRPRDYMSAFAFIPRYLEVNQRICSAVYLRHPVARPGLSEVPTPFAAETMGLAFNWYLRRR